MKENGIMKAVMKISIMAKANMKMAMAKEMCINNVNENNQ